MFGAPHEGQNIPVRIHQTDDLLVLAAPMAGLNAQDISVSVAGEKVRIRGAYRGPGQATRDLVRVEWTVGPYSRDILLPQPVNGELTNATYGNGVLVLSMPKLELWQEVTRAEFRLEVVEPTRGQRVGHTGSDIRPTTTREHRLRVDRLTWGQRSEKAPASPGGNGGRSKRSGKGAGGRRTWL